MPGADEVSSQNLPWLSGGMMNTKEPDYNTIIAIRRDQQASPIRSSITMATDAECFAEVQVAVKMSDTMPLQALILTDVERTGPNTQ